jgi:cation transport ATPase
MPVATGRGQVARRQLALGNNTLMEQIGVSVRALVPQAEALRDEGASVVHLAVDAQLMGLLALCPILPRPAHQKHWPRSRIPVPLGH